MRATGHKRGHATNHGATPVNGDMAAPPRRTVDIAPLAALLAPPPRSVDMAMAVGRHGFVRKCGESVGKGRQRVSARAASLPLDGSCVAGCVRVVRGWCDAGAAKR